MPAIALPPMPADIHPVLLLALKVLRDHYHNARMSTSQRARWDASDPGAPPNTCRYCGKHWRAWFGSKLDGHAACIVTDDFKREVRDLLGDPRLSYQTVAEAIGVTPAVVRSWTFPIRGPGARAEARRTRP